MRKIEALILGAFFGAVPVLGGFLAACLIHILFFEERMIPVWTLWGAVVGIVIDIVFLKRWVRKAYQMSNKVFAAIYIFYSIGVLGLCMGIPILEFPLGIAAGAYAARKIYHSKASPQEFNRIVKNVSFFAAVVMVLICSLIALWGAVGGMIGYRLKTPYLSFTFTVPIYSAVALIGGTVLVLVQYWLTRSTAKITFRLWR